MRPLRQKLSLRLACLVTGDAAQTELTAWTYLPMVEPDQQGPHREKTARLPSPPFLNATFFIPFLTVKLV